MKKLMFATALVASAAAFADGPLNAISFEGYDADDTFTVGQAEKDEEGVVKSEATYGYFFYEGDTDGSSVKAFGSGDVAAPSITRPLFFASAAAGDNYLELSTEGGTLWRSINTLSATTGETTTYALGAAQTVAAGGTYLDTLVQFTPTEDGGAPELDGADKLAIWLNVDSSGASPVTNLMVKAGSYDSEGTPVVGGATYVLSGKTIVAGEWYRLTVKAIDDILPPNESFKIPGFQVFVDSVPMVATTSPISATFVGALREAEMITAEQQTAINSGAYLPSLVAGTPTVASTLTAVGFKGSGALDDIVWTEEDPFDVPAADFTLTWPAGVTPVSYTIDGGTPVSLAGATSSYSIPGGVAAGSTVAFTFTNADGATKTMTAEATSSAGDIDAEDAVWGWADYLGDAVAGAYTIDDANDLDMLRKGVLSGLATSNETFKQTANIDMTSAAAFAGIGVYNANPTSGTPFSGTYDGQGFKIENITMTARNYGGVFNQVNGGTIQNLTVENITVPNDASGEYGYAIVGNAGNGATLQNLVAEGSFLSAAKPGTHNMAGIVVRECGGGANGSLIKDCTNNATIYGDYTKLAGICALTQLKVSGGGPATFDGCVNNGTLISARTSEANTASAITGIAGIVGYTADATVLKDCVNNGTITVALANQKVGELVGSGGVESGSLTDAGGNKADATKKMLHTRSAVTGFLYAIVENGVATTVLPPLQAGTTYLLEGNVAASETPVFTLAAAGDTIAFDTALGYTFAGTVDSAVAALGVSSATAGTVTTYTAFDAVAQITGGAKYATLQAAVDAATAGDTVTVLADCTISTSLSIAKNLTVHNDYTITGAVNYAICIGATVSFEGSGKIERASGITGSAFCVGANETTRGAITAGTAGTLNFTGLTVCGGSGGNLIKLENGTVTMNGGVLRDGKRGIKADADVGTYTSAIVINGGTITNNTDCAVMASAASADGTATVTINGGVIAGALTIDGTAGTYSITIPGTSTAMFDADQSTFCESGYETTDGDSDGWYTVSAVQSGSSDYKVVIGGSDVVVTPSAEDLAVVQAAVIAGGGTLDVSDVDAVNAAMAAPIGTTGIPSWQALFLGLPPTEAGLESFKVDSISIAADGKVTVTLPAGVDPKTGRGVDITLKLMGSDDLSTWSFIENASGTTFGAVTPGSGETKKFYKVVVEFAGSSN